MNNSSIRLRILDRVYLFRDGIEAPKCFLRGSATKNSVCEITRRQRYLQRRWRRQRQQRRRRRQWWTECSWYSSSKKLHRHCLVERGLVHLFATWSLLVTTFLPQALNCCTVVFYQALYMQHSPLVKRRISIYFWINYISYPKRVESSLFWWHRRTSLR